MSTSKTEDTLNVVQIVQSSPTLLELIRQAGQDVRAEAALAKTKSLLKMTWTSSCEAVTKQYFGDYYHRVRKSSSESDPDI